MSRMNLTADERRLVLMAAPLQAIQRPAFRGHPFRLAGEVTGSRRSDARFSEALVMAMIERGLLLVNQCARGLPARDGDGHLIPGAPEVSRPFSVILSKEGERQRAYLIADRGIPAANDAEPGRAVA